MQAQDSLLTVFVYKNGKAVTNFEIANINLLTEGSYKDGLTKIKAKAGDRLLLASASFEDYIYQVKSSDITANKIEVDINNDIIALEAVTVHQSAETYPFMNSKKPMTPTERRLYTSTYQKKSAQQYLRDFINKGPVLQLDPLINMISGRRKQLKKELAVNQKGGTASFLENNLSLYILDTLEVPESQFGLFIYYVAEKNQYLYKNKNTKQVKTLLRSYYLDFIRLNSEN
ncbi:hypothetical protein MQE36_06095 [Zhouia spongiae]|uniref:DUF4369 domain-containing protein n=1 Tax=Zhouia spongiae TaxID=2202721 RepID=A0ABY3YQS5_9FLAO|nr:hypothetical protein [Zhouia spongiae]UNY99917.1 hypothetical protein MQE36_06095 [Zhouia spongiae]